MHTPRVFISAGARRVLLSWLPSRRSARIVAVIVAAVAVTIIWVRLAVRPSSDLLNHREFGWRFIEGTFLYEGGLDYPYLPAWAAAHAPLALVPRSVASPLVFPFGAAALVLLVWMLERLARADMPLDATAAFWTTTAAIALTSRYAIRDLLDGGENLILTALAWGALLAWTHQKNWTGAWLLGAAIALKLTAAVFLLPLIVLGQYGRALRTMTSAAALMTLPVVRMGFDEYNRHVQHWFSMVGRGIASADPTIGVLGPEPVRNLSLRAAIGRVLVGPESSLWWREVAVGVALAFLLALGAVVVVRIRRRRAPSRSDEAVAWAAAGVLGLLISPITWRAHAVAIIPACYLLIRKWIAERHLFGSGKLALAAVAVAGIVLTRGVFGEVLSDWTEQWGLTTWALTCLVIAMATWPTRR